MNAQFAVRGDDIYVLEVNPRAVGLRLGSDLITELYCHQCGWRGEYFYPRRGRNLDLSCRNCDNEARPDYKRAFRVMAHKK